MLPSRWYSTNEVSSEEQFLVTDKFSQNMLALPNDTPIPYLYLFRQKKADFPLKNKSKSLQLIDLLQDFTEEDNTDDESDSNKSQQD
ncbi:10950_t:CDS:2, partial [Scutellospora calospora]